MAVITWPNAGRAFDLQGYTEGIQYNVLTDGDTSRGNFSTREVPRFPWAATIKLPVDTVGYLVERGELEGFLASLRGGTNRLAIWNYIKPLPLGTLRGNPIVSGLTASGSRSLDLADCDGTLLAGDRIGVTGDGGAVMRFMVVASTEPDEEGRMTVSIEPPARSAIAANAPVVWERPCTNYFITNLPQQLGVDVKTLAGITLNLVEVFA